VPEVDIETKETNEKGTNEQLYTLEEKKDKDK
jgi:hypothetical protein